MESKDSHNVSVVRGSGSHLHIRNHRHRSRLAVVVVIGLEYLVCVCEVSCHGAEKLQRYYDQQFVGSYGGVAALRRIAPDQDVERWLSEQDTYTLHKPVRRCADLVDVSRLKKTNDGTAFLLTVIDVFSKRAWCIPLKNNSAVSLVAAFALLLGNKAPITLQTDKGSEFLNRALQKLLKETGVDHFPTHNEETMASIVERFNRTT